MKTEMAKRHEGLKKEQLQKICGIRLPKEVAHPSRLRCEGAENDPP